jgi:hypothetical protein
MMNRAAVVITITITIMAMTTATPFCRWRKR